MQTLVTNPFGQTPEVQQYHASYSPAAKDTALRVDCVGQQIVKANPQLTLRPMFLTIGSPQPEVFHRGTTEIYVTEGLANKCVTEGQLAAVLCSELAKMAVDREVLALPETRQPERSPPPDVPVGNDNNTLYGAADGTRRVELAKFERDRIPRDVTIPPPSPDILARGCLQKAGFTLEDLDAAASLLRESEANGAWRKSMIGNGF